MKYKALAVVAFGAGAVLGLDKDQARGRAYVTTPIKGRDGWYTVTSPTQFKAGEEFLFAGELPKHMAQAVALPNGEPAHQAAADKAGRKTAAAAKS